MYLCAHLCMPMYMYAPSCVCTCQESGGGVKKTPKPFSPAYHRENSDLLEKNLELDLSSSLALSTLQAPGQRDSLQRGIQAPQ